MRYLPLTARSPAEYLAADEALLDWAESGAGGEVLHTWASASYFIVVGYANAVQTEVNVAESGRCQVPVFRRCSGGGTVVQGPGCLNYSLLLDTGRHPELASINVCQPDFFKALDG